MIKLHKLNQSIFYLNIDLIERIEEAGDTIITLVDGKSLRVMDRAEEIVQNIKSYQQEIHKN